MPTDPKNIPGCTYCRPQVASVGLTEAAAKEKGYEVKVGKFPAIGNGKAIALGEVEGFVKTVFDAKTGELLGAHMIGAEVTELIQGYTVGKTAELVETDFIQTVFPHPTLSRNDARERARRFRAGDPHLSAHTTSTRTLVIALLANLGIAVSKFVAAAITGSSAMLTEGVHSVVDSTNQLLLMWGRRAAKRPPDKLHPFGYGRELYFWSFVVAVLVFSLGAGVSIYEGIIHIANPEEAVSPLIAYVVLLVAFLLEGWSTLEAFQDFRKAKGDLSWFAGGPPIEGPAGLHRPAREWRGDGWHHRRGGRPAAVATHRRSLLRRRRVDRDRGDPRPHGVLLAYESKGLLIGEAADPVLVDEPSRAGAATSRAWSGRPRTDRPLLARPDHGDDERRLPRRHAGGRSRADRLSRRAGSARTLAGSAATVRPADARRRQGSPSLRQARQPRVGA